MTLYHFCCDHSVEGVRADGEVKPMSTHPYLGVALAWFTDLDFPDRDGLGLTSDFIGCDRTEWRVTVEGNAETWTSWARRHQVRREVRDILEEFARPAHWWVSESPLRVVRIESMSAVAS